MGVHATPLLTLRGPVSDPMGAIPAGHGLSLDAALTRRRLLLTAGATTAIAVAGSSLDRLSAAAAAANPWLRSRFVPYVGQGFVLTARGGRAVSVRLAAINDLTPTKRGVSVAGSQDGFVLLFAGPRTPRLEQDVMRVSHPRLGTLDLLVSPAGTGRRGQDYAAVINRLPVPRR